MLFLSMSWLYSPKKRKDRDWANLHHGGCVCTFGWDNYFCQDMALGQSSGLSKNLLHHRTKKFNVLLSEFLVINGPPTTSRRCSGFSFFDSLTQFSHTNLYILCCEYFYDWGICSRIVMASSDCWPALFQYVPQSLKKAACKSSVRQVQQYASILGNSKLWKLFGIYARWRCLSTWSGVTPLILILASLDHMGCGFILSLLAPFVCRIHRPARMIFS